MSEQGEQPGESVTARDWWSRLYAPDAADAGRDGAPDTLDERFASASRAVGRQTPSGEPAGPGERTRHGASPDAAGGGEPGPVRGTGGGAGPAAGAGPGQGEPDTGAGAPTAATGGAPAGEAGRVRGVLPPAEPGALADLVPDTVLDGAHYGGLTLRAASTRGEAARERGTPRGEALLTARFGGGDAGGPGVLLVAVAAGQAPEPGGRRAARELVHLLGEAVGRSRTRLAEDLATGRRSMLKSGLKRLTDRCYGRLRAQAAALGLAPGDHTAGLRCLLLPADPRCTVRLFFGYGDGGLFRLRHGVWQDVEPRSSGPAGSPAVPPAPAGPVSRGAEGPVPGPPEGPPHGSPEGSPDPAAPAGGPVLPGPFDRAEPEAEPEPFRFRAGAAEPGDVLLLCTPGLAGPLRTDAAFAGGLADRWGARGAAGPAVPDLPDFLADVRQRDGAGAADRTAVSVWED
ncbi:protein phosphatase 2C domain-containing protein [Streptomyces sp. JJ36]|uniref:protein phosphatase 2C domain-containing protein n=1 Tax=Streptomyces sp. JJ36 TaxID=2736645 RepID=UPI001F262C9C|nr:protein phosphatase 2C domain-containing protein [Streptomyces sp. JJ36]MCF6525512.1 protein phosphatase 2C domain-containing protein [Streptomyces sp. JJ36]